MMNDNNLLDARLIIRISKRSLSFAVDDAGSERRVTFEPYVVKSGISIAANLREAFRESMLLGRGYRRALVLTDSPVLLIPLPEFEEAEAERLYRHSFAGLSNEQVITTVMPEFSAVAVYTIGHDLQTVVDDHFQDVRYEPLMLPVWRMMHQRNFTGMHRKLYGYFHDGKLEVFCFDKNRFRFSNSFETRRPNDAVYFLLHVWKVQAMNTASDELYLSGEIPDRETLAQLLGQHVKKTYFVNPSAVFNRSHVTQTKDMPLDLMAHFCMK